jgi:hypothetical protein
MVTSVPYEPATVAAVEPLGRPIYIDLGTRRKKAIRQLSRGQGPLAAAVEQALNRIKGAGTFSNQPVVVVVRERPDSIMDAIL